MDCKNVLSSLRQMKFPECTIAALNHFATIVMTRGSVAIPGLAANCEESEDQILSEFIFFQHLKKKRRAVPELQIVDILLNFFSSYSNEAMRHLLFKMLFIRSMDHENKLSILTKLISMAVGLHNAAVLDSAAVWMQTQGCNDTVTTVVADVVLDYTSMATCSSSQVLKQLPKISSHFACNFLTVMTCIYALPGTKSGNKAVLTEFLLELICDWLTSEPRLSLISLYQVHTQFAQSQRATLWTSPTKPNMQTPVPGLMRWSTKAPLVASLCSPPLNNVEHRSLNSLWSSLHLAVLQSLIAFPTLHGSQQLELITLADMNQTVKDILVLMQIVPSTCSDSVTIAMDRLIQILQVALATGAFRCSLGDLRGICQRLPPSRLLKIVHKQHLSFAPPPMHNAS